MLAAATKFGNFLSKPLISGFQMAFVSPKASKYSLSDLPTELLILVCEHAHILSLECGLEKDADKNTTFTTRQHKPHVLDGLSRANSRLREICRPYLFQHLFINLKSGFDIEALKLLSVEKDIMDHVNSLAIYSALKTPLDEPGDPIFGGNATPEVVFGLLWWIIKHISVLKSLSITIDDKELNNVFQSSQQHFSGSDDEDIQFQHLEELTISENSTWVVSLGGRQPQLDVTDQDLRDVDSDYQKPKPNSCIVGLTKLNFVHVEEFGPPRLHGLELYNYIRITEDFFGEIMDIGLEYGLANGIKFLNIERTLDFYDLEKIGKAFPELEVFEYWIDRPLSSRFSSLLLGSRHAFSSIYKNIALGIGPLTGLFDREAFDDIKILRNYCRGLSEMRIEGVVRVIIRPSSDLEAPVRGDAVYWVEDDGANIVEVSCV